MEMQQVTVLEMMLAREARADMQRRLLAEHPGAVIVCLTMNIAGPVKTTPDIERAFAWGQAQVRAVLAAQETLFAGDVHGKTGPEAIYAVRGDAKELKRRLCALEDGTPMGRLLDIDVIAPYGEKIARTEIGFPARRCLLCGEEAPVCARSRAHGVEELFARAHALIRAHFEEAFARCVGQNAQRALLCEVAVTPKPGLVDRQNAGAHEDMDVFTFIDSACALRGYFEQCAHAGLAHRNGDAGACFDSLRVPGLLAEADMRAATGGVNTHKGAIFSLGVFCAALGMGFDGEKSDVIAALERCGEMTGARMARELERAKEGEAQTFGERLYQQRGIGGVRSEAAGGFAGVREVGLPRMRACLDAGMSVNDAGLCTLVALMACTQDTNAVRRGGCEGAQRLRDAARRLSAAVDAMLADGTAREEMPRLRVQMEEWDRELSVARISPGGCADLLAMTLLARFMQFPS
ncbi:MAG: citrate lyase holo-[acyl-carrier protein] synthase [Clostridia bacterium]|nr:citrate lyase holo-[acyl-carrier protein] synthase [Clostridia bacterium]